MLMPILWMVSTSLKPLDRVFELPIQWIPRPPRWENYPNAWNRFNFARYFVNSFIVSAAVTLLNVLLPASPATAWPSTATSASAPSSSPSSAP